MELSEKQRKALEIIGGEVGVSDLVEQIEAVGHARTMALESAGVQYKQLSGYRPWWVRKTKPALQEKSASTKPVLPRPSRASETLIASMNRVAGGAK